MKRQIIKYGDPPCFVDCHSGYTLNGLTGRGSEFMVTCGSDGQWHGLEECKAPPISISGRIDDAQSSRIKLAGATVRIEKDGSVLDSVTTGRSGVFNARGALGNVSVTVVQDGYIAMQKYIMVNGPVRSGQAADMALSKVLPLGAWRATLTWGAKPTDLDTWIKWGKGRGTKVYYGRTKSTAPGTGGLTAELDRDDVNGYGPETTTFTNIGSCETKGSCLMYFEIDNYTPRSGSIGAANAKVTIYRGDRVEAEFPIPTSVGTKKKYIVFTLDAMKGHEKVYAGDKTTPPYIVDTAAGQQDWFDSFDSAIWSKVKDGGLIYALYRSSGENLGSLEMAKYYNVQDAGGALECTETDWSTTFQSEGWATCSPGSFLAGFYRASPSPMDDIGQITKAYCCKPKHMPSSWGNCYEQGLFVSHGWSTCQKQGGQATAMVALHRTSGSDLSAINTAKCCAFADSGLVPSPPPSPRPPRPARSFHRRRRRAWASSWHRRRSWGGWR